MKYDISMVDLKTALTQPGCPICQAGRMAIERNIHFLLYENVNSGIIRQQLIASMGFCPEHTLQLVQMEKRLFGNTLGFSIIHQDLANHASQRIAGWQSYLQPPHLLYRLRAFLAHLFQKPVPPRQLKLQSGNCLSCRIYDQNIHFVLEALFYSFETSQPEIIERYKKSFGLCLQHLNLGLALFASVFPLGCQYLAEDCAARLKIQSAHMQEYIRKHDWNYRDEKIRPQEEEAWKRTLSFFGGSYARDFLPTPKPSPIHSSNNESPLDDEDPLTHLFDTGK